MIRACRLAVAAGIPVALAFALMVIGALTGATEQPRAWVQGGDHAASWEEKPGGSKSESELSQQSNIPEATGAHGGHVRTSNFAEWSPRSCKDIAATALKRGDTNVLPPARACGARARDTRIVSAEAGVGARPVVRLTGGNDSGAAARPETGKIEASETELGDGARRLTSGESALRLVRWGSSTWRTTARRARADRNACPNCLMIRKGGRTRSAGLRRAARSNSRDSRERPASTPWHGTVPARERTAMPVPGNALQGMCGSNPHRAPDPKQLSKRVVSAQQKGSAGRPVSEDDCASGSAAAQPDSTPDRFYTCGKVARLSTGARAMPAGEAQWARAVRISKRSQIGGVA